MVGYDRWVFTCYDCHLRQYVDSRLEAEFLQYGHERCNTLMSRAAEMAW